MFYIDKRNPFSVREVLSLHVIPSVLVFLAFLIVALITWNSAKNGVSNDRTLTLERSNSSVSSEIQQRFNIYQDILRGGSGLFEASTFVSREEWKSYLDSYKIEQRYPGIEGVGYVEVIPKSDLPAHLKRVRDEGYKNYNVFPSGEREIYSSVVYIEPFTNRNLKVFGYDMYTDTVRQAAMNQARDTGEVAVSSLVTLRQDKDSPNKQPGFLMFIPIYANEIDDSSPLQQKKDFLRGYIYAPFRAYDFIKAVVVNQNSNYGFQIFNTTDAGKETVYKSDNFDILSSNSNGEKMVEDIEITPAQKWEVEGVVGPEIISANARNRPSALLWAGIMLSFFTAGFLYLLLSNRARSLQEKEEKEIQEAKDELLALASHQLRTPATGVKQYVGMLKEGYAGSLTKEQRNLVNKAYQSNERQLTTINEMLIVARADAGNLSLDFKRFNLTKLLLDIIDEQSLTIKKRRQTLVKKMPKNSIYAYGDQQYIRMVLENLLNNATKYTGQGGSILITLKTQTNSSVILFQDTGVGVTSKDLSLLFKKFARIPNELTGKVSGTGIGLYLSKKIIDLHHGSINFDSSPGKGSTVKVRLPNKKVAS